MKDEVPKALNWVKARAECSIEHLFILLSTVVETDTKAATERGRGSLSFAVGRPTEDTLLVVRKYNDSGFITSEAVAFDRLRDGSIHVSRRTARGSTDLFLAKPHVDLKGDCKFEVDGVPLEPWQVSKRALEDLFFEHGLSAGDPTR